MCDQSVPPPSAAARLVLCQLVDFHDDTNCMPLEAIPSMVHGVYMNCILHIYFCGDRLVATVWYSDKGMGSMAEV
jgi:hypothetical protein